MPMTAPRAAEPPPAPPGRPPPAFAVPPRTLLLVEDSRLAAEAVRLICRRAGLRLRRADSLAAAARHLRVYRPDIALIDLGLPDGSGVDLIAALARLPLRPGRLVAISGDAGRQDAALAAGADAFLLKPVTLAGHLAALTGEAPGDWPAQAEVSRERNAGADPLALRDDLRRARALLDGPDQPGRLHYAGQFLASVGQALHDPTMARAALAAARAGDRGSLVALVQAKAARTPMI